MMSCEQGTCELEPRSLSLLLFLWFTLAHFCSFWLSLAHSGSLSLAHSRSFWLTLTQCGSLRLSQALIISQRLGRIATVYPTLLRWRLLSPLKCERQSRAGTRRFDGISVEGSEGGRWNFPLFPLFVSTSSRRWSLVPTISATLMVSLFPDG